MAKVGGVDAMYSVGYCYNEGIGLEKNAVNAVKWYRHAAALQHLFLLSTLKLRYKVGDGVGKSTAVAFSRFKKAANGGS